MLGTITSKITNQIVLNLPEITPDKAEQIEYGLYMAFSDILKVSAVIIVSTFFNLTYQTITALLVFGLLRVFLGGIHSKTQIGCILTYFIIIFGSIGLSKLITFPFINFIIFPAVIVLAYIYAPADLPCKPIASKKHFFKLRVCGLAEIIIFFAVSFFVPRLYCNIISINTLVVVLMLTPVVYNLTGNTRSNALKQGGETHEK